jgi:hypothetical protein
LNFFLSTSKAAVSAKAFSFLFNSFSNSFILFLSALFDIVVFWVLYSWQKQFKTSGFSVTKAITPDNWSAEERFATVLETVTLSEIEVSEYCRIKGLYPDQIKTWKLACIEGNAIEANKTQKTTISNKADKKRIKESNCF